MRLFKKEDRPLCRFSAASIPSCAKFRDLWALPMHLLWSETALHIDGVPVCAKCDDELQAGREPPHKRDPQATHSKTEWGTQEIKVQLSKDNETA